MSSMKKELKEKLIKAARIAAIILLLLVLFKGKFVLVVLIALSLSMSFIVNNLNLRQVGIELASFTMIMTAIRYGPLAGALAGFFLISYHLLAGGFFGPYLFWVIPAYTIAGALAGYFTPDPGQAIYYVIAINISNSFFTAMTNPSFLPRYLIYVVTNIIFNSVLFSLFGGLIHILMT